MNPAIIAISIELLELAVKQAPEIKAAVIALLQKEDATPEQWAALRAKILMKSYEDYTAPHKI